MYFQRRNSLNTEDYHGEMAGVIGLEPMNAEIKTPCLTTWRHPSNKRRSDILQIYWASVNAFS